MHTHTQTKIFRSTRETILDLLQAVVFFVKTNSEFTQYTRELPQLSVSALSRPADLERQSKPCEARANVPEDKLGVTPRG